MTSPALTVEALIAMRDASVNATFMDFNHAAASNPEALFVFYEGQDNDYYYPRLKSYSTRDIEPFRCNGKAKVIGIYKVLITKPEYNKYHKGFFVDKDFDINADPALKDFYVTSGYSIENYYLSDNCLESFLKQNLNFHSGDSQLAAILDDYRIMRQKYLDAILLFNTWYCAVKRKYGDVIRDINLGKKMPKGYIIVDFDTKDVIQQYSMGNIAAEFNVGSYPVSVEEMSSAESYIKTDLLKNHRGKYGLSFLYEFIVHLMKIIKDDPALISHYRRITISHDNIISILSPYSDTEQGVIDYIQRVAA